MLSPQWMEALLREQLKTLRVDDLFGAMERMHRVQTSSEELLLGRYLLKR